MRVAASTTGIDRTVVAAMMSMVLMLTAGIGRTQPQEGKAMSFSLASSAFSANGVIPALYTCKGRDISPPLAWSDVPAGAKSLALIVDDPDAPDPAAPTLTWVHWVLYGIPASATGLAEAVRSAALPPGTREGMNDFGRTAYGGPCPPIGRHRYFFKLYALDTLLPDLRRPTKAALEKAMQGHVLAQATLIGTCAAAQ
jgi:hypothetical protein